MVLIENTDRFVIGISANHDSRGVVSVSIIDKKNSFEPFNLHDDDTNEFMAALKYAASIHTHPASRFYSMTWNEVIADILNQVIRKEKE